MSLEDKLVAVREASAKRISPERLAVMHAATEQLRGSGILDVWSSRAPRHRTSR